MMFLTFLYVKDYAESTGSIATKLGGRIGNRPKKSSLNFDVRSRIFTSFVKTAVWDIFCPAIVINFSAN